MLNPEQDHKSYEEEVLIGSNKIKTTIYKNNHTGHKGIYETKYYYVAHIKRGYFIWKPF